MSSVSALSQTHTHTGALTLNKNICLHSLIPHAAENHVLSVDFFLLLLLFLLKNIISLKDLFLISACASFAQTKRKCNTALQRMRTKSKERRRRRNSRRRGKNATIQQHMLSLFYCHWFCVWCLALARSLTAWRA